jgi:hypothetical protein
VRWGSLGSAEKRSLWVIFGRGSAVAVTALVTDDGSCYDALVAAAHRWLHTILTGCQPPACSGLAAAC